MIVGKLENGQEWYVGPDHRFLVDGTSFKVSEVESLQLRLGDLGHTRATGPDGEPLHGVVFSDPVSGLRVILALSEEEADELVGRLTAKKIRIATTIPREPLR